MAPILVGWLCDRFVLPRQVHAPYIRGPVPRLRAGGRDYRGAWGHRDVTSHRGQGDPGDFIAQVLIDSGFEHYDVSEGEDLVAWKERQRRLNAAGCDPPLTVDGIPGVKTMQAWRALGLKTHNGYAVKGTP